MARTTGPAQTTRPAAAVLLAVVGLLVEPGLARAADEADRSPGFRGRIEHAADLSAIVVVGRRLIVASDEGCAIQVLDPDEETGDWIAAAEPIALPGCHHEMDTEALAYSTGRLYVLGSHSMKRRLLDPEAGPDENRARLTAVSAEPDRQRLLRLGFDEDAGRPTGTVESISLRPLLEADPLLGPFARIPATENGVNLEGLAVEGDTLWIGFRSPVLREGHVPVMILRFDAPSEYEVRFVQLGGAGVRSLARVEEGFLILARREHGTPHDDAVYLWDGSDALVSASAGIRRLLDLVPPPGGTPEGLAVLARHPDRYDAIVIHDGLPGGRPTLVRIPRPAGPQSTR